MRKQIRKIILLILLMMPSAVKGLTSNVILDCNPKSANPGSTITCTLKGTASNGSVPALEGNISLSPGLELKTCTLSSIWEQGDCNGGSITPFTENNKTGTFDILTFTVGVKATTSNANQTISINNIIMVDETFSNNHIIDKSLNIKVNSAINTLSSLNVSGGVLSPVFSENTLIYNANVNSSSTVISATLSDTSSQFISNFGPRTVNLNYGNNEFALKVKSESGQEKTYIINITRPDNRSSDNTLKVLSLSSGSLSPSFSKSTVNYKATVESNISSISVSATLNDSKSSFVSGFEPRKINLNYGENKISIKIKAENTANKEYIINVTRKDDRSANAYLSSLTLSNANLLFKKDVYNYLVNVDDSIEKIKINAVVENSKSKVEGIGEKSLKEGENTFELKVTAEKGNTQIYKVIIVKEKKAENVIGSSTENLNEDNYLKELSINNYSLDFSKTKLSYDLKIFNETELDINAITNSPKSSITIVGNENLENGSKIKIIVTAENNTTREYIINIQKGDNINQHDKSKAIIVIVSYVILISVGIFVIVNKKKVSEWVNRSK